MSRNLTRILMAVLVLNAIAVASSMLTNAAHSTSNDAVHSAANNAVVAMADFDYLFSTVTAAPYRIDTPAQRRRSISTRSSPASAPRTR